jgi:ACT domain-containing protein
MKAVLTVIGKNKIGIMAGVTSLLAESGLSILDISQTILREYFTMIMIVDLKEMNISFSDVKARLETRGEELQVSIKIQHEDIFNSMHHI